MSDVVLAQSLNRNQIYSLRVNQLDAKLLDSELCSSIEANLNETQVERVRNVVPELLALVRAYIWYNSVMRKSSSVGHSLLQLKYYDLSTSGLIRAELTKWQSCASCLFQVITPWLKHRISSFTTTESLKNSIEIVEHIYRTMDLVNDIVFLYYGKYRCLWERLVSLATGSESIGQTGTNSQLYLETMNRELLWHTFAEFLTFVLPLINFYRMRNTFNNLMRTHVFHGQQQICSNVAQRQSTDLKVCVICEEWPVDAHEIGCRHVFCYYCLMANFLSDQVNGFTCHSCFYRIESIDSIRRAKIDVTIN